MKKVIALMLPLLLIINISCQAEDYSRYLKSKTYLDDTSIDYVFEVPDEWRLTYAGDYQTAFAAFFEPDIADGTSFYYMSMDLYDELVSKRNIDVYKRSDLNTSTYKACFSLSEIAASIGVEEDNIRFETINGKEYIFANPQLPVEDPSSSEMHIAEMAILIENGYYLVFAMDTPPNVSESQFEWYRMQFERAYSTVHFERKSNYEKLINMMLGD